MGVNRLSWVANRSISSSIIPAYFQTRCSTVHILLPLLDELSEDSAVPGGPKGRYHLQKTTMAHPSRRGNLVAAERRPTLTSAI